MPTIDPLEYESFRIHAFYQSGLTTAVFECPTNWNLFGKWNNGYPAHLSPTDSANAAKALSTNYTSHTYPLKSLRLKCK